MRSGWQRSPYFRRYDWELVKPAISLSKSWGGYRRTTLLCISNHATILKSSALLLIYSIFFATRCVLISLLKNSLSQPTRSLALEYPLTDRASKYIEINSRSTNSRFPRFNLTAIIFALAIRRSPGCLGRKEACLKGNGSICATTTTAAADACYDKGAPLFFLILPLNSGAQDLSP